MACKKHSANDLGSDSVRACLLSEESANCHVLIVLLVDDVFNALGFPLLPASSGHLESDESQSRKEYNQGYTLNSSKTRNQKGEDWYYVGFSGPTAKNPKTYVALANPHCKSRH